MISPNPVVGAKWRFPITRIIAMEISMTMTMIDCRLASSVIQIECHKKK